MRRGTRWTIIAATMWLAGSLAVAGYAFASEAPDRDAREVLGPGDATVTLHIEHSRFDLVEVFVQPHMTVTFRVVNHDPITHEFIVGGDEVHDVHEAGTHGTHGAVPGEVTVAPGEVGTTTFAFHSPGTVLFACHLPGHLAYGMTGEVVVRAEHSATD